MEIPIVILTHKRAGHVRTHHVVPGCLLCVPEDQVDRYAAHHDANDMVVHPASVVGLWAKRQWVYEKFGNVFMLDDDVVAMFRVWRPAGAFKRATVSGQRIREIIEATAETARDLGAYLFGFGAHSNPMTYHALRPFKLGGYSPGGAMGMLAGSKLSWPTDITMPQDDMYICLLNAHFHRHAFYDCRFAFTFADTYKGHGGLAEFRSQELEVESTTLLQKLFGRDAVRPKGIGEKITHENNASARSMVLPWTF